MKTNKQPEPKQLFQQHHKEIGVLKIKKRKEVREDGQKNWENNEENVDIYNVDK